MNAWTLNEEQASGRFWCKCVKSLSKSELIHRRWDLQLQASQKRKVTKRRWCYWLLDTWSFAIPGEKRWVRVQEIGYFLHVLICFTSNHWYVKWMLLFFAFCEWDGWDTKQLSKSFKLIHITSVESVFEPNSLVCYLWLCYIPSQLPIGHLHLNTTNTT